MAHLAGLDAITLIKLILDAQYTKAAEHSDTCKDFFKDIKYIGNLLVELRVCDLHKVSEIKNSLIVLEESLRLTYLLVADRNFDKARKEVDKIISSISLIFLVDHNGPPQITNPADNDIPVQQGDGEVNRNVLDKLESAVDDVELMNRHVSEEDDWVLCSVVDIDLHGHFVGV